MKTFTRLAALPVVALGLAGCFEIDQGITLQRDLSGQATLVAEIDMERMVEFTAKMQRQMMGQEGPPGEDELAAARKQMLERSASQRDKELAQFEEKQARLEESLPEGVTLGDVAVEHSGLVTRMSMQFVFDHVSKLSQIELPEDEPQARAGGRRGRPAAGPPTMEKPFEHLVVEEADGQVRLTMKPAKTVDPDEVLKQGGGAGAMPGVGELVKSMLGDVTYTLTIRAPLEVAETNATERLDDGVVWRWDMAGLQEQQAGGAAAPTVVFRTE